MRALLSGNEAIALGAYEAGVRVATAYPGTPSTEILETVSTYDGIDAQWSPNEKVALEVGMGAAFCGARVLVCMKHVGLNVAADPLMTLSYTGIRGGLVLVTADDPGAHSSQNEQDNRHYARLAKVPMLEPSDSQEARDFTIRAFELSEEWDTPVLLRITTRIAHTKGVVVTDGEPVPGPARGRDFHFEREQPKLVMVPGYARPRHALVEERMRGLAEWAEATDLIREEGGAADFGVVTSGICYQYVKEIAPDAPVLKLGLSWPLPAGRIARFASSVGKLYVVEELDPFVTECLKAMGLSPEPRDDSLLLGELNPERVAEQLGVPVPSAPAEVAEEAASVPGRPPVMCPGCPHRGVYYELKRLGLYATGDIGCYTLGALPPLSQVDTCVCMGAGIGHALGMRKVLPPEQRRSVVAVIGDSTFVHSGITGVIDGVYNGSGGLVLILDNRTTAMTGLQDHPATGTRLSGEDTHELDLSEVVRAAGVRRVSTVDPYDLAALRAQLEDDLAADEPAVIICRRECRLIDRKRKAPPSVSLELCRACGMCAGLGCPAITMTDFDGKAKPVIDPILCIGCDVCCQVCQFDAITPSEGD